MHWAKIVDSKVVKVIKAEADFFDTFVDDSPGEWIQTSYNSRGGKHYGPDKKPIGGKKPVRELSGKSHLRYNYAGIGYTYDKDKDAFIPPKPIHATRTFRLNPTELLWEDEI